MKKERGASFEAAPREGVNGSLLTGFGSVIGRSKGSSLAVRTAYIAENLYSGGGKNFGSLGYGGKVERAPKVVEFCRGGLLNLGEGDKGRGAGLWNADLGKRAAFDCTNRAASTGCVKTYECSAHGGRRGLLDAFGRVALERRENKVGGMDG